MRRQISLAVSGLAIAMLVACGENGEVTAEDVVAEEAALDAAPNYATLAISSPSCQIFDGWIDAGKPENGPIDPISNRISFGENGSILWNGETVTRDALGQYLDVVAIMQPVPPTILELTGAENCAEIEDVTRAVEEAVGCANAACRYMIGEAGEAAEGG
ncbi:hypothetical protein [Parasphingopyxis marina]|uniref:Lipoprotein n=1 Tax=Parasphingopyxis marina TaxID=2761622 RepID=A0A842HXH8_9SPHN|nr:hypothetical protein [Parasphingopyxis marina]MBC2777009.1 hypothetical protein [Parasphingopyxis marina]